MSKIRLGVIGCGGITKSSHISGLKELKDEINVTSVCDIIEDSAKLAGDFLEASYITTNYREMLDYVDAVLIALPHDLHYECGLFFANNKKHILMEKPLCNSEAECLSLIEAAEKSEITLMTAYPVRYWPEILKLKTEVDSGKYGRIIQMSVWTEQHTHYPDYHWGNTARLGGGQFFSHGCHYIDLLLFFLGNPVSGIHIGTRVGTEWLMEEGTSNAIIKFENGSLGYHFGTWGAAGTKMNYDFQIHCEKAMIEYDLKSGRVLLYEGLGKNEKITVLMDSSEYQGKRMQLEMNHFLECIKNKSKPQTNAEDSLQGLRVIWELYNAEKNGKIADLRGLGFKAN